jgi:hypothetical protein
MRWHCTLLAPFAQHVIKDLLLACFTTNTASVPFFVGTECYVLQRQNTELLSAGRSMVIFEVPQSLLKFLSLIIKSYNLRPSDRVLGNALKIHIMSQ